MRMKIHLLQTNNEEEYTPKLFSEEQSFQSDEINSEINDQNKNDAEQLFDQDKMRKKILKFLHF